MLRVEQMEIVMVVLYLVFGPFRPALSYRDQGSISSRLLPRSSCIPAASATNDDYERRSFVDESELTTRPVPCVAAPSSHQ